MSNKLDAIRLASAYFPAIYGPTVGVLYMITLFPIVRYPKRYQNAFYYFVLAIGVAEIYNLCVDSIFSCICYLKFKCPGPQWLRYGESMVKTEMQMQYKYKYKLDFIIKENFLNQSTDNTKFSIDPRFC